MMPEGLEEYAIERILDDVEDVATSILCDGWVTDQKKIVGYLNANSKNAKPSMSG